MHKWILAIYFCTVTIAIQIQALHRIIQNDSIPDALNQSMIVNDFVKIQDSDAMDLTSKKIPLTYIRGLPKIDSNRFTDHLNTSFLKNSVGSKNDITSHLNLFSVDKNTNSSSVILKAISYPNMSFQLEPSDTSNSLQLPNIIKTKKITKITQTQGMNLHQRSEVNNINKNMRSSNVNSNAKHYELNNHYEQNTNNINENSNGNEHNITNKMIIRKMASNGINESNGNYVLNAKLNKIQNINNIKGIFNATKNNITGEGTCTNDRNNDNRQYNKLINMLDNNHVLKQQQSLQPQVNNKIDQSDKRRQQLSKQIYPQEIKPIQKLCQENKDKFANILRFANMLLYKVNPDTALHTQRTQYINNPNLKLNSNNPIKGFNPIQNIISAQTQSNPMDPDIDSIDYLYNAMNTLPYLHTLTGVTGTNTNINRPFILQSNLGVNDFLQSFHLFENALDIILNADEDYDEIELRCPVHQELKNVPDNNNNAIGNEERNGLMHW